MAKRKSEAELAAGEAGEVDAAEMFAPASDEGPRSRVVYRGGHPLIRRAGVVLRREVPQLVTKEVADLLARSGDVEIVPPEQG